MYLGEDVAVGENGAQGAEGARGAEAAKKEAEQHVPHQINHSNNILL
jgi:hypothetical protein